METFDVFIQIPSGKEIALKQGLSLSAANSFKQDWDDSDPTKCYVRMSEEFLNPVKNAFQVLMGMNGDDFVDEIAKTGMLSQLSYIQVEDNIQWNGKESIVEYFGLVHYYYIQFIKTKR